MINYTKLRIKTTSFWDVQLSTLSPALVCPPFLDVTYIIDCAVNCHVIVVTGDVEWTVKFNGPLEKKNITQLVVRGFVMIQSPPAVISRPPLNTSASTKHSANHIWRAIAAFSVAIRTWVQNGGAWMKMYILTVLRSGPMWIYVFFF